MRILILEEALERGIGHWPVYLEDIARGLRRQGDTVHLLAHRRADPALLQRLDAIPWLSRSCWSDPRAQGQLGGIRHAWRFACELRRWLHQHHEPYDWICSLTMRLPHLLAYTLLVRGGLIPKRSRCLLLFVQGFGDYGGLDQPVRFPRTPSNRLARWCFRRLRSPVHRGEVLLAAETTAMQQELGRFSGLPVALFPHPVEMSLPGAPNPIAENQRRTHPITIACPGLARYEKGSDLLLQAIRLVWAQPGLEDVHFVCQWPEPFAIPEGSLLSPDPELLSDPRFELINDNLDSLAYQALLDRSDLIVLPYRRASYFNRVSRVAIEAAIQGVPLLSMRGTWAEELVQSAGCKLVIAEESAESVASSLIQAIADLPSHHSHAVECSPIISYLYSPLRFRECLSTTP